MINRDATVKLIEDYNADYQVVIYSKSYCPFCQPTKNLFKSMPNLRVKVIELDREVEGIPMQQILLAMTGQRTVPNVFVRNQHIGGNDDVQQAYRDGSLQELLSEPMRRASQGTRKPFAESNPKDKFLMKKLQKFIHNEIGKHQVVIWSKSDCYNCRATKKKFDSLPGVDVVVHDVDDMKYGELLKEELASMTRQMNLPSVFINGRYVGGNSDVQNLAWRGVLRKIL